MKDKIIVGHAVFNDLAVSRRGSQWVSLGVDLVGCATSAPVSRRQRYSVLHTITKDGRSDTRRRVPVIEEACRGRTGYGYPETGTLSSKLHHHHQAVGDTLTASQVEDAKAAMLLFMTVRRDFEVALAKGEDPLMGIPR